MTTSNDSTRNQERLEHLARVNALGQAIAAAITAIENNDLAQLEIQLAQQETICNRIAATEWKPLLAGLGKASTTEEVLEIRRAHRSLAQLNRVYAALLKRARRSVVLIAGIYRSYGEGYDHRPSPVSQGHTWSCEV